MPPCLLLSNIARLGRRRPSGLPWLLPAAHLWRLLDGALLHSRLQATLAAVLPQSFPPASAGLGLATRHFHRPVHTPSSGWSPEIASHIQAVPACRPSLRPPLAGFELFVAISLIVLIIILPINCTGGEVANLMDNPVRSSHGTGRRE